VTERPFVKYPSNPLLVAILICGASISSFAQCVPFDGSDYPVFQSLFYVSAPNWAGDQLVVGSFKMPTDWQRLNNIPLPSAFNQQFCGSVYIAPGIRAQAYVPTAGERAGDFSAVGVLLLDPTTGTPNPVLGGVPIGAVPFPGAIIPASRLGGIWAWRVSSVQYVSNTPGALTITSPSAMPLPVVGSAYSQQLSAVGGIQPYKWSIAEGALPLGLSLNAVQGAVSGIPTAAITPPYLVTIQVTDAASATSTMVVSLGLEASGGQLPAGVLSQIAVGAGWKTTLYLSNTSTSAAATTVSFRGDQGESLSLPLTVRVAGSTLSVNAANAAGTIAPNSIMVIEAASDSATALTGWAQVISTSTLSGYAVFRSIVGSGPSSEGTVPLETSYQTSFSLIYDNTSGQKTALAVANLDSSSAPLQIVIYDENGNQVDATATGWPAGNGYGHRSFMLTDLLPKAVGNRGIVVISTPLGQQHVTGLGLRASATGSFSSIPKQLAPGQ
jgi:hypothetical protein